MITTEIILLNEANDEIERLFDFEDVA
jgi:hypothetical protein